MRCQENRKVCVDREVVPLHNLAGSTANANGKLSRISYWKGAFLMIKGHVVVPFLLRPA